MRGPLAKFAVCCDKLATISAFTESTASCAYRRNWAINSAISCIRKAGSEGSTSWSRYKLLQEYEILGTCWHGMSTAWNYNCCHLSRSTSLWSTQLFGVKCCPRYKSISAHSHTSINTKVWFEILFFSKKSCFFEKTCQPCQVSKTPRPRCPSRLRYPETSASFALGFPNPRRDRAQNFKEQQKFKCSIPNKALRHTVYIHMQFTRGESSSMLNSSERWIICAII